VFFSGSELALKNLISYTHDYPLDLKIEPSVQPKNTFNNRRVVWVISVAPRKPRGGSTLSSFDRSSSQIAPSAANVGTRLKARRQRTDPFSIYTLHRHELVTEDPNPQSTGYGGARRNWRRDGDRCRHREARNAGRSRQRARRAICSIETSREDRIGRQK